VVGAGELHDACVAPIAHGDAGRCIGPIWQDGSAEVHQPAVGLTRVTLLPVFVVGAKGKVARKRIGAAGILAADGDGAGIRILNPEAAGDGNPPSKVVCVAEEPDSHCCSGNGIAAHRERQATASCAGIQGAAVVDDQRCHYSRRAHLTDIVGLVVQVVGSRQCYLCRSGSTPGPDAARWWPRR